MKPSVEQLENLLALKREERPEEGYWQDFLCEFHHRQRKQAVKQSGLMGFGGRFTHWFRDIGPSKWAYGAGLAYASIAAAVLLTSREVGVENPVSSPVNFEVVPAASPAVEQLDRLDLSPSTQGSVGEQVF